MPLKWLKLFNNLNASFMVFSSIMLIENCAVARFLHHIIRDAIEILRSLY